MEIALLKASSCFIPSNNFGKVCVLGRNFRSSLRGKYSILIRNTGTASTRRATVTSVFDAVTIGSLNTIFLVSQLGKKVTKDTIIPDSDYRIPVVLLGAAGGFAYADNLAATVPIGLLGLFLLVQEVKIGDQLEESGENALVGGKNSWK